MKKILLMITLICGYMGSMWGQSFSISGPSNCNVNVSYNYYILLSAPAKSDLYFNLKASHGSCSPVAILISKGQRSGVFSVRWTSETTNGIITAATPGGAPATSPGVRVVKEGGVISDKGYTMSGPDVLHVLETGKYSLANYTLESSHKLEWHDLYKISNIEPVVKYGNFTKIEDYANITPLTPSRDGQTVLKCLIKDASGKEIGHSDYKYVTVKEPLIIPAANLIASNQNITYTLKDYYPSASITWEAGSNMTLVSGQGTPTAIFKASGNGVGAVKATVTYEGKRYTVENSDVWVGAPLKPLITPVFSKFFAGSSYDVMITNVSPGSKVTWDISGATITSQTENSVLIKVANFDLDGSVFIIATVENKCGTSRSSISIPVKGLGGGGGVYPEI